MALRLGQNYQLLSAALPNLPWDGPVVVHIQGTPPPARLLPQQARELAQFCLGQGFPGVLADWPEKPSPVLSEFTGLLGAELAAAGLGFALPLGWHQVCPTAQLLVPSALSGGTLRGRLAELSQRFGSERLILQLQRSRAVFSIPSPNGQGIPVDEAALIQRKRAMNPRVFFSPHLCAQYVTWQEDGVPKLLLFDDAHSLRAKRALAGELGIPACVAAYPEVKELLPQLLAGKTP
jgi:hypothetical protein